MAKQPIPETMIDAVQAFATPGKAHDFLISIRFPNGVACPRLGCGSANVAFMAKYYRWYCNECKRQFSVKVGTIFEDSPISLTKWLPAVWLIASNRNGISSYELARALKVTQKTAWFMLHRIREAMSDDSDEPLKGIVEADESYIGGRLHRMSKKRRRAIEAAGQNKMTAKAPVFGIVERKGRVRAWAVPNVTQKSLLPKIRQSVHHDATLYTDESGLYHDINEHVLYHETVNHDLAEYVRGNVHTNNIECFWAVLKRTLGGTYIHVNSRHLDRYLQEQAFRFNERESKDGPRFAKAVKATDGKRLTYKALIAKG
jgi:transposase-like protein